MTKSLRRFEIISRRLLPPAQAAPQEEEIPSSIHPFEERNIHPDLVKVSKKLFDDGHYSLAVLEAFKYIDQVIKKLSKLRKITGHKLMMAAFDESQPKIQLTDLANDSEIDEQFGYRYIFAGSMSAIRNPRAHEPGNIDSPEDCLEHLSFASILMRRLSNRVAPPI